MYEDALFDSYMLPAFVQQTTPPAYLAALISQSHLCILALLVMKQVRDGYQSSIALDG